MDMTERKDILSLLPEELEAELAALGQPRFRAGQVFQWLSRGVRSFEGMTNLSKELREELESRFYLYEPKVLSKQGSAMDGTVKYLWDGLRLFAGRLPAGLRLLRLHHRRARAKPARIGNSGRGAVFRA